MSVAEIQNSEGEDFGVWSLTGGLLGVHWSRDLAKLCPSQCNKTWVVIALNDDVHQTLGH